MGRIAGQFPICKVLDGFPVYLHRQRKFAVWLGRDFRNLALTICQRLAYLVQDTDESFPIPSTDGRGTTEAS